MAATSCHPRQQGLLFLKLITDTIRCEKEFFSVGVIDEWNSLPGSVIHSNTVNTFKAKIDCLFKNWGGIYTLRNCVMRNA